MAVEILSKNAVRQRQAAGDERVAAVTVADIDLRTKGDFVREIFNLWRDVQRRVLMIGRYLNRAKTLLPHGEFQQMIKAELPFSEQVAYQMRQVAAAVECRAVSGRRVTAKLLGRLSAGDSFRTRDTDCSSETAV